MAAPVEITLSNQLTEIPRALAALQSCAHAAGIHGRAVLELELALEEMLSNVVQYAQSGVITVRLICDASGMVAEVLDNGLPFNPLADAPTPDLATSLEERRPSGLGVHLARRMVDLLDYHREGRRNHVILTKNIPEIHPVAPAPTLTWNLGNDLAQIPLLAEAVERFLGEHRVPDKFVFGLNLALDELLTNILSYGFKAEEVGSVQVRIRLEGQNVITEVEDNAPPFNPLQDAAEPDLEASLEERRVGGLGIHLVRKMVDTVQYRHSDGHNLLRLSKALA